MQDFNCHRNKPPWCIVLLILQYWVTVKLTRLNASIVKDTCNPSIQITLHFPHWYTFCRWWYIQDLGALGIKLVVFVCLLRSSQNTSLSQLSTNCSTVSLNRIKSHNVLIIAELTRPRWPLKFQLHMDVWWWKGPQLKIIFTFKWSDAFSDLLSNNKSSLMLFSLKYWPMRSWN